MEYIGAVLVASMMGVIFVEMIDRKSDRMMR